MKPALAALILRPAVPGDRKGLDAPIWKFDQILLKGIDTERVFDLVACELAVGAVSLDEKFVVLLEEARMDAVVVKACVLEIAKDGSGIGVLHGMLVLGLMP